jgi:hypothetical protein
MTGYEVRKHPLPWRMPGRENWVRLQPNLDYGGDIPRPFQLRLGDGSGVIATLTADELRALRDVCDAALTAPYTVLVLGGDTAADWMLDGVERHLGKVRQQHESMVIRHAGRPGTVDGIVSAWCRAHRTLEQVGPVDVADGGSACLIFCTRDGDRNLELNAAAHRAGIPAWWCRSPAGVETTEGAQ